MVTAKDVNAVLKNQVDPVDPIDPIAAVSHSDPYPYFAALRAKSGVHWFADLKLWGLVNAPLITDAFNMEQAKVRPTGAPVPAFMHGAQAGEVFGRLARMCDGPQHTAQRARTMLLMRQLDGPLVANGAAQVVGTVASQWREHRDGAALNELIRALPVMSILAALGFASHCFTAMLACTDAWVAGLSPLATSATRGSYRRDGRFAGVAGRKRH